MEFNYLDEPLKCYIDKVSERSPCPGGGSVSILSVSLADSLICMVANYSIGSKFVNKESQNIVENILKSALILKEKLSPLIEKDSYIYEKIRNSYKSGLKNSSYSQQIEDVLKESFEFHLDILNDCSKITEWNQLLVDHCNPNLISDVAVSSALIIGAIKATRINILINLKGLKDKEFIKNCLKGMNYISAEIEKKAKNIIEEIENKIKGAI